LVPQTTKGLRGLGSREWGTHTHSKISLWLPLHGHVYQVRLRTPVHYLGIRKSSQVIPPMAGLAVHISEVKIPNLVLHTLCEIWTTGICFPNCYYVPIVVTAGWIASLVNTRSPLNSCIDWSNVLKETTATLKWYHFNLHTGALTIC